MATGTAGLEPKPGGRPRKAPPEDTQVKGLKARVVRLELELKAAQIREQIALVLPGRPAETMHRRGSAVRGKKARARRRT